MRVDGKYLILVVNLNELLPNDLNSRRLLVVSLVWSGPGSDGDDINWIDMQLMGDFFFPFAPSPPVLLLLFPLLNIIIYRCWFGPDFSPVQGDLLIRMERGGIRSPILLH